MGPRDDETGDALVVFLDGGPTGEAVEPDENGTANEEVKRLRVN